MLFVRKYVETNAEREVGTLLGSLILGLGGLTLSLFKSARSLTADPGQFFGELQGFANYTGVPFDKLLILNLGYDILARCTSIVSQDSKGIPFMLRNMDWDAQDCVLRAVTIDCRFIKNGVPLYRATTHAGFVGIYTGIRYPSVGSSQTEEGSDGFTISINYRMVDASAFTGGGSNLLRLLGRAWPLGMFIRKGLEGHANYDSVLNWLKTEPLIAPSYIIVAGTKPGQGALITRQRDGISGKILYLKSNIEAITSNSSQQEKQENQDIEEREYLIQTNIDWWENEVNPEWAGEDELLLSSINRRNTANEQMKELIQDWKAAQSSSTSSDDANKNNKMTTVGRLLKVLLTPPVCNRQTIYAVLMSAAPSDEIEWNNNNSNLGKKELLGQEEQESNDVKGKGKEKIEENGTKDSEVIGVYRSFRILDEKEQEEEEEGKEKLGSTKEDLEIDDVVVLENKQAKNPEETGLNNNQKDKEELGDLRIRAILEEAELLKLWDKFKEEEVLLEDLLVWKNEDWIEMGIKKGPKTRIMQGVDKLLLTQGC